jgi:hypothetical protein
MSEVDPKVCRICSKCGEAVRLQIFGQPYSKENRRIPAKTKTGKPFLIKSKEAQRYSKDWKRQCPVLEPLIEEEVEAYIKLYYRTRLPDLDESLVLDLLQGRLIKNDRQVRRKVVDWGLSRDEPRSVIVLRPMAARPCYSADGCLLQETIDEETGL